jgi:hypothetical protein
VKSDLPAGPDATPSPLERQQVKVTDVGAQTFWHWVRFDVVADAVVRSHARQVVDIGAGSGMLGDWLAIRQPGVQYRFDELSPLLDASLAARFGPSARYPSDAEIPPSAVVTLLDVIEHIEDDSAALRQLAIRMSPGASLVVTVPAMPWAYSQWDVALGHFRRYSRQQLRTLLESTGFEVDECSYLFVEMTPMLPVRKFRRTARADADFPAMSPAANRIGYAISSASSRLRRFWPIGSSVVAIGRRSATQ